VGSGPRIPSQGLSRQKNWFVPDRTKRETRRKIDEIHSNDQNYIHSNQNNFQTQKKKNWIKNVPAGSGDCDILCRKFRQGFFGEDLSRQKNWFVPDRTKRETRRKIDEIHSNNQKCIHAKQNNFQTRKKKNI
jgi:hypothetical protein